MLDFTKAIIPLALMASELIAHEVETEWAIDSEPIRARGVIVKYYFIVINLCSKVGR